MEGPVLIHNPAGSNSDYLREYFEMPAKLHNAQFRGLGMIKGVLTFLSSYDYY